MRITITILITLLAVTDFLGQQSFNNELLLLEQKIYTCRNDTERIVYNVQKFDLFISNKDYSTDALKEAKRIDYELIRDTISRFRFLWNASLVANLNNDKSLASYYYKQYRQISNDTSIQSYLLSVLINNGYDTIEVSNSLQKLAVNDKNFNLLKCMNNMYEYTIKNKILYPIASALIPGSGSMMNGDIGKGTASLLINSVSAYAIYILIQNNLYLNAILWGAALGLKFYIGNIKLTTVLVDEKESRKKNTLAVDCKCVLNNLLIQYPVEFK